MYRTEDMFAFNTKFEEVIKQKRVDTVVVVAHKNPDGDAVSSVMAISHYIHFLYPDIKIIPHLEPVVKNIKKIVDEDMFFGEVFIHPRGILKQKKDYVIVCCDTATAERIGGGRELFDNANISFVVDHHLLNNAYGDYNFIFPYEACAQNVNQIIEWNRLVKQGMSKEELQCIAQYIYLGILHDTSGFQRVDSLTLKIASQLIEFGEVNHKKLERTLHGNTLDDLKRQNELLNKVIMYSSNVAYLYVSMEECEKYGYSYDDIHRIPDALRDNCSDIDIAFALYEIEDKCWKCSMRSTEVFDSNEFLKRYQGGGHKGAASFIMTTDRPKDLLNNILRDLKKI